MARVLPAPSDRPLNRGRPVSTGFPASSRRFGNFRRVVTDEHPSPAFSRTCDWPHDCVPEGTTMLRIERSVRSGVVVFAVSGRIGADNITELQRILDSEAGQWTALHLKDVSLVDRHAVRFLARCEAEGTALEHCPIYLHEWIVRERTLM